MRDTLSIAQETDFFGLREEDTHNHGSGKRGKQASTEIHAAGRTARTLVTSWRMAIWAKPAVPLQIALSVGDTVAAGIPMPHAVA